MVRSNVHYTDCSTDGYIGTAEMEPCILNRVLNELVIWRVVSVSSIH